MKTRTAGTASILVGLGLALPLAADETGADAAKKGKPWRGLHLTSFSSDKDLELLGRQVPKLAEMGLNTIILEINYSFHFESYPKLRGRGEPITREGAAKLVAVCKKNSIRLIPQFQCLGHQSWKETTFPLLTNYPEFDLTPGAFPKNKDIYCREWDPLNPKVNEVVFKLIDEIIDAFGADAFHVGMDEVFLIGSEHSPSTKGKDPAKVFAQAVNDLHAHLVKEKKVEMLMWSDRLFDGVKYKWDEWEASKNRTAPAVDLIPKDIILCPWHYEKHDTYPSVPLFTDRGFRVLPASWKKTDASNALIRECRKVNMPKLLGHLFTTWGEAKKEALTEWAPMVEGLKLLQELER